MPKGGWLFVLAVGGLITLASAEEAPRVVFNRVVLECDAYGCWEQLKERSQQPSYTARADGRTANESESAESVRYTSVAYAPAPDAPSEDETQRDKDDLKAQQEMARWAARLFWATLLGVGLIGWTLWETRRAAKFASDTLNETTRLGTDQLNEAKNATAAAVATTEATREVGSAQSQAYLTIQKVFFQFDIEDTTKPDGTMEHKTVIYLSVQVKNTGQTPAHMVRYDLEGTIRVGESFERELRRYQNVASKYASIGAGEAPIDSFSLGSWGLSEDDMKAIIGQNPSVHVDVLCRHGTVFRGRQYSPMKQSFMLNYWWQDFGSRFFEEHEMRRMQRLF